MDIREVTLWVAKKIHHSLCALKKECARICWIVPTNTLPVHRVIQPLNGLTVAVEEVVLVGVWCGHGRGDHWEKE